MKKNFLLIIIFFMANICSAEVLEGSANFDWINRSQIQRDAYIINVKETISADESMPSSYTKEAFKDNFSPYLKDASSQKHYALAINKVNETSDYKIAGFFRGSLLIMYGIQYKDDMKHIYYYDVYGNLRYIDIMSNNFPNFPYYSKQYKNNGKCVGIFYYLSEQIQFIYTPKYEFKGVWQGKDMYDKKAKKLLTRTAY